MKTDHQSIPQRKIRQEYLDEFFNSKITLMERSSQGSVLFYLLIAGREIQIQKNDFYHIKNTYHLHYGIERSFNELFDTPEERKYFNSRENAIAKAVNGFAKKGFENGLIGATDFEALLDKLQKTSSEERQTNHEASVSINNLIEMIDTIFKEEQEVSNLMLRSILLKLKAIKIEDGLPF